MKKAAVFLADGFEEIEGLTVIDTLRRAGVLVTSVSVMERRVIDGAHNIKVYADKMFEDVDTEEFDMLVLPGGGAGTQNLKAHEALKEAIKKAASQGRLVGAVCSAPTVLSSCGILDGKKATCYPGCEKEFGTGVAFTDEAVVRDGNIITAKSMGAALLFSLALTEALCGEECANKVKNDIVYCA